MNVELFADARTELDGAASLLVDVLGNRRIYATVVTDPPWLPAMALINSPASGIGVPRRTTMDIVKRLRDLDKNGYQPLTGAIGEEAATEIEKLRKLVAAQKREHTATADCWCDNGKVS
jgi:hypothetical protein